MRRATAVQDDRMMFNNPCSEVLKVAEADDADGELAYKSGRIDEGLGHLRAAVQLDDDLLYDEPWGWMQPSRHALGACSWMRAGSTRPRRSTAPIWGSTRPCRAPASTRATSGACTASTNACNGAARPSSGVTSGSLLDQAIARAEVPIRASCYCRSRQAAA
jgi:hypothetical protein